MLTSLSLWGVYFASYMVDFILILIILIAKHMIHGNGNNFWKGADLLVWGILLLFVVLSIFITNRIGKMKPNTRIKAIPEKNITHEMMGYLLAQVVTVATTIFTDWWILINVALFIVVGLFFVKSNAIQTSPLFVVPLGNKIFQSGDDVIISNYSIQEMRMAQEDNPDGIEARELTNGVFYVRK